MSEKHLIEAAAARFRGMDAPERVKSIRKLVSQSAADAEFIRQTFPDLYAEAFPSGSSGEDASSESDSRPALHARRR